MSAPCDIDDPRPYVLGGLIFQSCHARYLKDLRNCKSTRRRISFSLDGSSGAFPKQTSHRSSSGVAGQHPIGTTISYLGSEGHARGSPLGGAGERQDAFNSSMCIETADDPKQLELDAAQSRRSGSTAKEFVCALQTLPDFPRSLPSARFSCTAHHLFRFCTRKLAPLAAELGRIAPDVYPWPFG